MSYTDPSGFKTISDYEKEIEEKKKELEAEREKAKGSLLGALGYAFNPKNWARGAAISDAKDAIANIESGSDAISRISDVKIDARQQDDVDPNFVTASRVAIFLSLPGGEGSNQAAKGNYKGAAKEYLKDGLIQLVLGRLLGPSRGPAGGVEGKIAAEVTEEAVEQTAKATVNGPAANRAAFEAYKDTLRAEMSRPAASNPELNALLDKLYRPNAQVGSGSTAAAFRQEVATGQAVGGAFHGQKLPEMITALQRWLNNNAGASTMDRAAAENVIKDMQNALATKP